MCENTLRAGATVKPSLMFFKRFTEEEQAQYNGIKVKAFAEVQEKYIDELTSIENDLAKRGKEALPAAEKKILRARKKEIEAAIDQETKTLVKQRFDYVVPIADIKRAGINSIGIKIENDLEPLLEEFTKYRKENNLWNKRHANTSYQYNDGKMTRIQEVDGIVCEPEVFYGKDLGFTRKYPMARIGSFLVKSKDIIEVKDDVEYKQVTIKINNGGVVPRNNGETILGSEIKTIRQHVVHAGQFIMSKIDARNGAYGIVPAELEGAIVTNDFPVFDVDTEKIIPQFLVLVSTTEKFVEFARKCSSGTTNRKRIDIEAFLNQQIPLPSIEEQKLILDDYNTHMESAIRKEYKIKSLAVDSQQLICNILGIKQKVSQESKSLLQFIHLTDTGSRWDALVDTYAIESKYRIENLGKFIIHISTGTTPPTSHPEYFDGDVKFFTPADLGNNKYLEHSSRTITDIAIDDKKARVYHKGDILFVGIGSTVGKVGIVKDEMVSSNQQITGFTIDSSKINPEYVYYYLLYNRDITTADQSKTTLPIVNQDKICKIPIVVPPIKVQDEIVSSLDKMYLEAKRDEKEITVLERKAISLFEHKIFD